MKRTKSTFLALLAVPLLPFAANADLIVSDWNATATTLTFDITGTIDAGVTFGPVQAYALFIGPSNLGNQAGATSTSGIATSLGGSPTALASVTLYADSGSDKLQIRKSGFASWAVGDILNYSVSFSSASLVDLSAWDPTGAIISAGRSVYADAPEAAYQVGTFAAVPEPGTLALFGIGLLGLAASRRRKKA